MVPPGAFFPQRPSPVEGEGDSPVASALDFCLVPLRSGVFRSGDRWPSRQVLPEEKRHSPERVARNPRKGRVGSSLSGWPQAPSGVPGSPLSLFSRGLAPVSPQSTSGFPLPEKNPKTHGVLASQDSVPQGMSHGRPKGFKKLLDRTRGYRFMHHNSCGTRKMKPSAHAPFTHCACAKWKKKKSKTKDSNQHLSSYV